MKFQPKTEEEAQMNGLLDPGVYAAEVTKAEATVSKKGNDMIALTLRVFDGEGGTRIVFDYLLEQMAYKLRHFAEASGLMDRYEHGELTPADCEGRSLSVVLEAVPPKGDYGPKNAVKDYVVPTTVPPSDDDDDLPDFLKD